MHWLLSVTQLTRDGFDDHIIIEALFNWSSPEVCGHIAQFQESKELHTARERLRIPRDELLALLEQRLSPDDYAEVRRGLGHRPDLSPGEILHLLPEHYPTIVHSIVETYLPLAASESASTA